MPRLHRVASAAIGIGVVAAATFGGGLGAASASTSPLTDSGGGGYLIPSRGWATNVTDVMDERLAKTNDSIALTQYRAGSQACQESAFPSNGNILSQWGALARGESNTAACGGDESWRDIDEYYYTSSVVSGSAPAAPTVSTSQIAGGIRINFESVGGWSYELQIFNSGTNTWGGLTKVGWSSSQRAVMKKFDFTTSSCQQYRVRAVGPAGASAYQSTGLTCP